MFLKEFDVVRIKDGRTGTILDFYDNRKVVMLEIVDDGGQTLDTPFVDVADIVELVYIAEQS